MWKKYAKDAVAPKARTKADTRSARASIAVEYVPVLPKAKRPKAAPIESPAAITKASSTRADPATRSPAMMSRIAFTMATPGTRDMSTDMLTFPEDAMAPDMTASPVRSDTTAPPAIAETKGESARGESAKRATRMTAPTAKAMRASDGDPLNSREKHALATAVARVTHAGPCGEARSTRERMPETRPTPREPPAARRRETSLTRAIFPRLMVRDATRCMRVRVSPDPSRQLSMTTVGVTKAEADSAPSDVAIDIIVSSARYVSPPFRRISVPANRPVSTTQSSSLVVARSMHEL